jgi:hypothetical protein
VFTLVHLALVCALRRSENDPVDGLSPKQLFTVYAMCDCGRDLEAYQLASYEQARSLLLQVRSRQLVLRLMLGIDDGRLLQQHYLA